MTRIEQFDGGATPWRLAAAGRQLDAEVVRLVPAAREAERTEEADVLLCATEGGGSVELADGGRELAPGSVVYVPRGERFALRAGPEGLACLTVTRAGAGAAAGGEAVCWLERVCVVCGRMSEERGARYCGGCGAELGS
jgi:quercetin dioxygenase-like cupin family protein